MLIPSFAFVVETKCMATSYVTSRIKKMSVKSGKPQACSLIFHLSQFDRENQGLGSQLTPHGLMIKPPNLSVKQKILKLTDNSGRKPCNFQKTIFIMDEFYQFNFGGKLESNSKNTSLYVDVSLFFIFFNPYK